MVVCLSIDVGIKNLAFCLLEKDTSTKDEYNNKENKENKESKENKEIKENKESKEKDIKKFRILQWSIIDLSQSEQVINTCQFIEKEDKNKKEEKKEKYKKVKTGKKSQEKIELTETVCGKEAKYKKNGLCYCPKHSKKQSYQIPTPDLKPTFLNKQKIQKLYEIAGKYAIHIPVEKGTKKAQILEIFNEYLHTKCFEEIEKTNASKIGLITIGKNIKTKFDASYASFLSEQVGQNKPFDSVIIENQISPIATRMKTIQGMVAQYFIMNDMTDNIEFVSSVNKLKEFEKKDVVTDEIVVNVNDKNDKTKYNARKKLSVTKTREMLEEIGETAKEFLDVFNKSNKKDDMADCFLQGYWYMNKK
jgi:O-methyltransferase involved in polyketide biosynthesis